MRLSALILAAGLSSRMGKLKALLPLDGGTLLSCAARTLRGAGIEDITVVTGHRADEVGEAALALGLRTVHNPDFADGMFSSVRRGVGSLPPDTEAFAVLPVDIPLVRPATVRTLIRKFADAPDTDAVFPSFSGERGHPPIISAALIPDVSSHDGSGGLRTVIERPGLKTQDVPVPDAAVLCDMDSPSDYKTRCGLPQDRQTLTDEEVRQLWEIAGTPEETRAHCRTVSALAEVMTEAVNSRRKQTGHTLLSSALTRTAALTHDAAKGGRGHAQRGAELLERFGLDRAAAIVADHDDLAMTEAGFTEREIVFLADKYVQDTDYVRMESRYQAKLSRFGRDPEIRRAITSRLSRAFAVALHFHEASGREVPELFAEAKAAGNGDRPC